MNYKTLEEVLNICLKEMKDNNIKYMISVQKQNELVTNTLKQYGLSMDNKSIAIIANFIYTKQNKYDSLTIQLLNSYIHNYYNSYEYNDLLDTIEKVTIDKQADVLKRASINTYLAHGYNKVIYAINNLIANNSYDGFSKHDIKNKDNKISYRMILSQNIEFNDVEKVIKYKLKQFNISYTDNYIKQYVNNITQVSQLYIFNEICKRMIVRNSIEWCIKAIKNYINGSSARNRIDMFPKTDKNGIKYHRELSLYVDYTFVLELMKIYLINNDISVEQMTTDELIINYVNILSGLVKQNEHNIVTK